MNFSSALSFTIALLMTTACSKTTQVTHSDSSTTLEISKSGIGNYEEILWNVGRPKRTSEITKGLRLEIALPDLSAPELRELHKRYQADAWMARISRLQSGNREIIGYFYVPVIYVRDDGLNERNVTSGMVQILYSDAAPSKRFADFPCPAFGHSLKVTSVSLDQGDDVSMNITAGRGTSFKMTAKKLEFGATVFNGGKKLTGLYFIELAFYNSLKQTLLSDFTLLAGTLKVNSEQSMPILGCSGFTIPEREEESGSNNFKFGR